MHVISDIGKKASIGMYVPLDDYEEDMDEQEYEEEKLVFEISFCEKGHVSY